MILDAGHNLKHKALLMTLCSGGLRLGEALALLPSDVDIVAMSGSSRSGGAGISLDVVSCELAGPAGVGFPVDRVTPGASSRKYP